jgi:hypothetical protein
MDGARIFLKGPTRTELIPMVETAYAAEHLLQEALASYPELLPGDQISEGRSHAKTQRAPRR